MWNSGKSWSIKVLGVVAFSLLVWFIFGIWTGPSYAIELYFNQDLRSHLIANYGDDLSNQTLKFLSLSIIGDVLKDQGTIDDERMLFDEIFQDHISTATTSARPNEYTQPVSTSIQLSNIQPITIETESSRDNQSIVETAVPTPTVVFTPTARIATTATQTSIPLPSATSTPTEVVTEKSIKEDPTPTAEFVEYSAVNWRGTDSEDADQKTGWESFPTEEYQNLFPNYSNQGHHSHFSWDRNDRYLESEFSNDFENRNEFNWRTWEFSKLGTHFFNYFDRNSNQEWTGESSFHDRDNEWNNDHNDSSNPEAESENGNGENTIAEDTSSQGSTDPNQSNGTNEQTPNENSSTSENSDQSSQDNGDSSSDDDSANNNCNRGCDRDYRERFSSESRDFKWNWTWDHHSYEGYSDGWYSWHDWSNGRKD